MFVLEKERQGGPSLHMPARNQVSLYIQTTLTFDDYVLGIFPACQDLPEGAPMSIITRGSSQDVSVLSR